VMPVLGNEANAFAQHIDCRHASQIYSIKDYAACFGGAKTYNRLSKFLLSIAFDTCDSKNFTRLDCQVQSPQRVYSAVARNVHVFEVKYRFAGRQIAPGEMHVPAVPNHVGNQLIRICVDRIPSANHVSEAHHTHPVADFHDLCYFVGHDEDAEALAGKV